MNRNSKSVFILASGGIDSTALIHYYSLNNFKVSALYINYGHVSHRQELEAVKQISKYYGIKLYTAKLGFPLKNIHGEFIGRNALLILSALNFLPDNFSKISIGIHSGVPYYDCSRMFMKDIQSILDGYYNGTVLLEAPFIDFTKSQIIEYCLNENVPIELTYSCEKGFDKNCGRCLSCIDRRNFLGKYDLK